jgi:dTDP-4-dehydrorhamnose reductase
MTGMKIALVTGGSGFIGSHICRTLAEAGRRVCATFGRHDQYVPADGRNITSLPLNLTDSDSITRVLNDVRPNLIVHTAAMSGLKDCEERPQLARRINTDSTAALALWCLQRHAHLIFLSTDQVFDGVKGHYVEDDPTSPIHVYGRTKAAAEKCVLESGAPATVLRLSLVYGRSPGGERTHNEQVIDSVRHNRPLRFFSDEYRNPILVEDVASAVTELAATSGVGVLHLAGPDRVNRVDFGRAILQAFGCEHVAYDTITLAEASMTPQRPPDLSLDTTKARRLLDHPPRSIREGLRLLADRQPRLK